MAMPLNEGDSATMPVDEEPAPAPAPTSEKRIVQTIKSVLMNLSRTRFDGQSDVLSGWLAHFMSVGAGARGCAKGAREKERGWSGHFGRVVGKARSS